MPLYWLFTGQDCTVNRWLQGSMSGSIRPRALSDDQVEGGLFRWITGGRTADLIRGRQPDGSIAGRFTPIHHELERDRQAYDAIVAPELLVQALQAEAVRRWKDRRADLRGFGRHLKA